MDIANPKLKVFRQFAFKYLTINSIIYKVLMFYVCIILT